MTARNQAKQDASDKLTNMHLKGPVSYISETAADIASNVWEPIVRAMVEAYDYEREALAEYYTLEDTTVEAFEKAREALGT